MSENDRSNPTSATGISSDVPNQKEVVAVENNGATQNTTINRSQTYSQIATSRPKYLSDQNQIFPKKDQAIIVPSHAEVNIEECVKAISEFILPQNILYAQKISNNRTCVFLKTKEIVDNLMEKTNSLQIKELNLPIRRLITPAKRVIITGGSPIIPHIEIEKILVENEIKLVTGVTFMRSGIKSPELQHIQTFNRQFYASIPDELQIPETLTITYDNETYRLFLTISGSCFKCRKEGHVVKECPLNQNTTQLNRNDTQDETPQVVEEELMEADITESTLTHPGVERLRFKRPKTDSISSTSLSETEEPPLAKASPTLKQIQVEKVKQKKLKTVEKKTPVPIEEMMEPLEEIIDSNPTEYPINFEQLKEYIAKTKGCSRIKELTKKYSPNLNIMVDMLRKLWPELKQKNIKARFTKIIQILESEDDAPYSNTSDDEQKS